MKNKTRWEDLYLQRVAASVNMLVKQDERSLRELARQSGLSVRTICRMCTGEVDTGVANVARLAVALDVPIATLIPQP